MNPATDTATSRVNRRTTLPAIQRTTSALVVDLAGDGFPDGALSADPASLSCASNSMSTT